MKGRGEFRDCNISIEGQVNDRIAKHLAKKEGNHNIMLLSFSFLLILVLLILLIRYSDIYSELYLQTEVLRIHKENEDKTKQELQLKVNQLEASNNEWKEKNKNLTNVIVATNDNSNEIIATLLRLDLDEKELKDRLYSKSVIISDLKASIQRNKYDISDLEALEELSQRVLNKLNSQLALLKSKAIKQKDPRLIIS